MSIPTYQDSFEGETLDTKKWTTRQIKKGNIGPSKEAADGMQSVAIAAHTGDCEEPCHPRNPIQRSEIRQHGELRPHVTDEFWQSFSFRVENEVPSVGSNRTVIGQWKAPGDDSPSLAHRYDNGVFHITIQDGKTRKIVASAQGDRNRLSLFEAMVQSLSRHIDASQFAGLSANNPTYYTDLIRASVRNGDGEASSILARLGQSVCSELQMPLDEMGGLMEEFSYVSDLQFYKSPAQCEVMRVSDDCLPSPHLNWVNMAYRVKFGRPDNHYQPVRQGEIDIYVDGNLFAEVRGNIGFHISCPLTETRVYLKLGMYRDKIDGDVSVLFDYFKQGPCKSDVM